MRNRKTLVLSGIAAIWLALVAFAIFALRPAELAKTSLWFIENSDLKTAAAFENPIARDPPRVLYDARFDVDARPTPWLTPWPMTAAAAHSLAAPTFEIDDSTIENGNRHVAGLLKAPKDTSELRVALPLGVELVDIKVEGEDASHFSPRVIARNNGYRVIRISAPSPDGVRVALTLRGEAPARVTLAALTHGFPIDLAPLTRARDEHAIAQQDGDVTVVLATAP